MRDNTIACFSSNMAGSVGQCVCECTCVCLGVFQARLPFFLELPLERDALLHVTRHVIDERRHEPRQKKRHVLRGAAPPRQQNKPKVWQLSILTFNTAL